MSTSEEQLVREMRHLKERAGLSYEKLAARTNYSRSSWERFLNGKKPVTRLVVEQLASALDDGRPDELLALWARTVPGHRDGEETGPAGPLAAGPPPAARQRGRLVLLGVFVAGVAVGAVGGLAVRAGAGHRQPSHGCFPHPVLPVQLSHRVTHTSWRLHRRPTASPSLLIVWRASGGARRLFPGSA